MAQETYRESPEAYNEPGSIMEERRDEKHELRQLNCRLEQFVRAQKDKEGRVKKLKKALAAQEVDFRQKLKSKEQGFERQLGSLRTDVERKQIEINDLMEELETMTAAKQDFAERLATTKTQLNESTTRSNHLTTELASTKSHLDKLVNEYSNMKYKHDTFETERTSLENQISILKEKNKTIMTDLTKSNGEAQVQSETFRRMLGDKAEEIEDLTQKNRSLMSEKEDLQDRLKAEFDDKLADFVKNREEQYKREKDEWVRIFKEEFNRKIANFKEANHELKHCNSKQDEELKDIRKRLAQLKQQKSELESTNRTLEGEVDKTRKDIDDLRRAKDAEIKRKSDVIKELRGAIKLKTIEYEELMSIKGQLSSEISMFRQILMDAEKTSGYSPSPGPLRKKRRLNSGEDPCYSTPGLARASQFARRVARTFTPSSAAPDDMKESSEFNSREGSFDPADLDEEIEDNTSHVTPGGPDPLQFSSLDLSQCMLELQNVSSYSVKLKGYVLSNEDRSQEFALPADKILVPKEKVRIVIGPYGKAGPGEIYWDSDVWCGDQADCARLFNGNDEEVGRIQISPDMVPEKAKGRGCLVM